MHGRDVVPAETVELVSDLVRVLGLQEDRHPLHVTPVHGVLQRHDVERVTRRDALKEK